jgi:hypothetical protein
MKIMANPIDTLRKLKGRSLKEIRVRSEQALSARTEQIGLSGKLPTVEEFADLIDKSHFNNENPSPEQLLAAFNQNGKDTFFQSFANKEKTLETFRRRFGGVASASVLDRAERILEGRFDLLGYQNLDFGEPVEWHYEPVAGKRAPLKHWKQFDELSTRETGDKKIIWELNRHQHFFTLGEAYWLTGEERYAETFARHLDDWIIQNPPGMGINWVSSLEVAFRGISWVWALNFFKNSKSVTPELFHTALRYLYLHGRHIEKYLSTYYSPNTHLTGEALGLYYLGTQFKFFTKSEHWRALGEEILIAELDRQILPDGVYFEQATWYQRYTADFYTHFAIIKNLSERGAGDQVLNERLASRLQKQLDFLMYITRPDGSTPLIGDDDGGRSLPLGEGEPDDFRYALATGAALFRREDYKFVARRLPEETLWLLGDEGVRTFESLPASKPKQRSRGFTSGGYYIMRDGWAETDNYLLVDGGNMGAMSAGHSHADALMIDCAAGGRTVLMDAGTYTYHESENSRDYFRSTMAHNTLSIGNESSSEPGGKFNWQTTAKTKVSTWISEDRFDFFEGEHDGYERLQESPATHTRSILFLKNDYWIMRDFVKTRGENSYQQNFHFHPSTDPVIEVAQSDGFCVTEKAGKKVGLRLFTFDANGGWQRKESWISRCYGSRIKAPVLRYISRGVAAQEFFTFLLPTDSVNPEPEVNETEIIGGRAFVINFRNYRDLLVFSDGSPSIQTEFFETNFNFLWARLSEGESQPEEYVLIHGNKFSLNGEEIINRPQTLDFVAARRLGKRLNVRTSENIFGLNLP